MRRACDQERRFFAHREQPDVDYFAALIDDPAEDIGLLVVSDVNYQEHFRALVEARRPELRVLLTGDAIAITEPQPLRTLVNCIIDLMTELDYLGITRDVARRLS